MRKIALFGLAVGALALCASAAGAAVKKYRAHTINISQGEASSPPVDKVGADSAPTAPFDVAFVDDSIPGSPVLKKFRFKSLSSTTVLVPGFAEGGFIFLNNNFLEGPGGNGPKPVDFTGTGSTAAGSTIAWGVVTGWTVTGAQWCKSAPPVVCEFANNTHETTSDPLFFSDFYDMGTWTFHATGFTAVPFVHQYFSTSFGNNSRWVRGFRLIDFSVPALPVVGVLLLGGSLVVGGITRIRRGRKD